MAKGVNKVIILGNLGNDPECRANQNGTLFANVSVATDESYKDKQTGQLVPKTEWHKIIFAGRLAEIVQQYLKKGSKVYIEGKLQTRKWQDQSGQDKYSTEIRAFEMQMLDSKQDGQGGGHQQPQQQPQQQAPQQQAPQQQPQQQAPQQQRPQYAGNQQQAPQQAPRQTNQPSQPGYVPHNQHAPQQSPPADDYDMDDDIPF